MPQANLIGLQQAHERAGAMVACQNASPVRQMSSSQGRSDLEATASSTTPVRSPQARVDGYHQRWLNKLLAARAVKGGREGVEVRNLTLNADMALIRAVMAGKAETGTRRLATLGKDSRCHCSLAWRALLSATGKVLNSASDC